MRYFGRRLTVRPGEAQGDGQTSFRTGGGPDLSPVGVGDGADYGQAEADAVG